MGNGDCQICSSAVADGLKCDTCQEVYHFKCGTGLTNISEHTISTYLADCVFSCPLCQVGSSNALVHVALTTNQILNESKHAIPFKLNGQITEPLVSNVEDDERSRSSTDTSSIDDSKPTATSTTVTGQPPEMTGKHDTKFKSVPSSSERRRIGRCRKPLFGLKHIRSSIDTLLIMDSNAEGVKGVT